MAQPAQKNRLIPFRISLSSASFNAPLHKSIFLCVIHLYHTYIPFPVVSGVGTGVNTGNIGFALPEVNTGFVLSGGNEGSDGGENGLTCPTGFILVPGNPDFATSDFCIAKYEMRFVDISDKIMSHTTYTSWDRIRINNTIISKPESEPIGNIRQQEAINACNSMGEDYHLITNDEWMTIARNIENVDVNWNGGAVGSGGIYRGNVNGPNDENNLGCYGQSGATYIFSAGDDDTLTSERGLDCNKKRQLKLSNGEIIWDLVGNMNEHVNKANNIDGIGFNNNNGDVCGGNGVWYSWYSGDGAPGGECNFQNGYTKALFGPEGNYNTNNGMGMIMSKVGTNYVLTRGGAGVSNDVNGLYSLVYSWNQWSRQQNLGFRCAYGGMTGWTDISAPIIMSTSPSGTIATSDDLVVTTTETATCKYDTTDVDYDNMNYTFTNTNSTTHTTSYTASLGLNNLYVRCNDNKFIPNKNSVSTPISFTLTCPTGFVQIPGNETFNTSNFCVAKYEMKFMDTSDKVHCGIGGSCGAPDGQTSWQRTGGTNNSIVSKADSEPIGNLIQQDAIDACLSMGDGYHLITNNEWMTIARDIELIGDNWTSGIVGNGGIFRGNNNEENTTNSLGCDGGSQTVFIFPAGNDDTLTSNRETNCNQKRQLKLSNGEIIWDLAGNSSEHVNGANNFDGTDNSFNGNVCGGTTRYSWGIPDGAAGGACSPQNGYTKELFGPSGNYNADNGIGRIYSKVGSDKIFIRGEAGSSTDYVGIFTLNLGWSTSEKNYGIGFRCAR